MTRRRRIARIDSNVDSLLAQGILLLIAFHLHYRKSYVWVSGAEGLQQGWQNAGGERRDIRQTKLDAKILDVLPARSEAPPPHWRLSASLRSKRRGLHRPGTPVYDALAQEVGLQVHLPEFEFGG
jgi:hypothetical protein